MLHVGLEISYIQIKNVIYNNGGTVVTCRVGDILYSDKKCYLGGMLAGKTPIGVVFDVSRRLAIALESSPSSMKWGGRGTDIRWITNITDSSKVRQDFNGKANTAEIKAYDSDLSDFPAAKYAYEYKTTGTNAGDWYLPALGELNTASSNKDFLNYALSLVGKKDILTEWCWSSSEYSDLYAWIFDFDGGIGGGGLALDGDKNSNNFYVRPVLAF